MAYEVPLFKPGALIAGQTLAQFRGVVLHVTGRLVYPATDGEPIVGVTQAAAASGEAVELETYGISKWEADGSLVIGEAVTVAGSTGKATQAASTELVHGRALENGDSDGIVIAVLLRPEGPEA